MVGCAGPVGWLGPRPRVATGAWPQPPEASATQCALLDVVALVARGFCRRRGFDAGGQVLFLGLLGELWILSEVLASFFFALAELQVAVAEPGAGAADELLLEAHVDDVAFEADAIGVEHVELGGAERRGDFV